MEQDGIIMKEEDYVKLSSLVAGTDLDAARHLEEELGRVNIVEPDAFPNDVVTMNSTVKYVEVGVGKEITIILVYPHDANIEENKVSVLAPVGAALIGLRKGQEIKWPFPGGKERRLKVIDVL